MKELRDYTRRIMLEKNLRGRDIEERSGGKMSSAYVRAILDGTLKEIRLEKACALADGLGVDRFEVFEAAISDEFSHLSSDRWSDYDLARTIEMILNSPELMRLLETLALWTRKRPKALDD